MLRLLRRHRSLTLAGLATVLLAAAPAASANVVIGQSIGGVQLGATKAQVMHQLGGNGSATGNPIGSERLYERQRLRVRFAHGRVDQLLSGSKAQRTDKGVGVGSRRAQIMAAYPHATCEEGQSIPYLYCVVGAHFRGRSTYTGFLFEAADGSVVQVELGYGSVAEALKHP